MTLIAAENWFAALEPEGSPLKAEYARVIAFETVLDDAGEPQMRVWLSGTAPVPLDHFYERTSGWVCNGLAHLTPEQQAETVQRGTSISWTWG
ncbi:hypothetical protein [Jatrophihabitans sp. GAS493]|uniref:hypothetical protein n=1 Tax=Jatrophihabitans sp. GAS493 TaxID=1907575 RepID=UPI000BB7C42A|nr:hypothetical protein [Jatrophihabitans sp. GAS493]